MIFKAIATIVLSVVVLTGLLAAVGRFQAALALAETPHEQSMR